MDLICYTLGDWNPLLRPAEPTRAWMDAAREGAAYRCLPLNIANSHGWEILTPAGFSAHWRGGPDPSEIIIQSDAGMVPLAAPVSNFGDATLTIPIQALFKTPPGWSLMIGGPPNSPKEGIYPLTGVVETDWSPYPFTMNWRFTRRNHRVRFEAGEPICFIMPVRRGALEQMEPKIVPLTDDPDLLQQHMDWREYRDKFLKQNAKVCPAKTADQWTKKYYVGEDMHGIRRPDHCTKLRLRPFTTRSSDGPE